MSKRKRTRRSPVSAIDRQLQAVYDRIPSIPDCNGSCAEACGPIAMTQAEWKRVVDRVGHRPQVRDPLRCPMLSPTGMCTVYSVRPFICRLWGTIKELECPAGCQPTRWLTVAETQEIFYEIEAIGGPEHVGPLGNVEDLWEAIALERRHTRRRVIERSRDARAADALREFTETVDAGRDDQLPGA